MSVSEPTRSVPLGAITTFRAVSFFERTLDAVASWRRSRATYDALSRLSDKQLSDIGLNRGELLVIAEDLSRR